MRGDLPLSRDSRPSGTRRVLGPSAATELPLGVIGRFRPRLCARRAASAVADVSDCTPCLFGGRDTVAVRCIAWLRSGPGKSHSEG